MDKNEYKNNKSLLGFVVDESKVSKEIDNEKENNDYLTTLLFELYPELNKNNKSWDITMINILYVGLGGFIGANLRYILGLIINKYYHEMIGTLLVNIIGSFLIGLLYGYINEKNIIMNEMKLFLPVGLLGSFTTFSTFSYASIMLIQDGNYLRAITNIVLSLTLCLIFAYLGLISNKVL